MKVYKYSVCKHICDSVPPGNNSGLLSCVPYRASGNELTLEGPIHTDLFQQDHLILNGVKIVTEFHPSSRKFSLSGDAEEYRYKLPLPF